MRTYRYVALQTVTNYDATAMFHTKWLLSRDVQRLTVDNDTATGCMSRYLKIRWKRLFRGNAVCTIHARDRQRGIQISSSVAEN